MYICVYVCIYRYIHRERERFIYIYVLGLSRGRPARAAEQHRAGAEAPALQAPCRQCSSYMYNVCVYICIYIYIYMYICIEREIA